MDAVTREKSYAVFTNLLEKKNVRPADVSKATGITSVTLSDWKSNKSAPNVEKLVKIANYFGVSVEEFLS